MNRKITFLAGIFAAIALAGCVSPGINAAKNRDAAQIQKILDQPNHGGEDLLGLLSASIENDCVECARALLKADVESIRRDPRANGLSYPLGYAAILWHPQMANLLIDYGADTNGAMYLIRTGGGRWAAFAERTQGAIDFFQKIEHERASRIAAPAQAAPVPVAAAGETSRARETPSFHQAERPNDYALIVGIEKYNDLPAATYAERDAAAAADFVSALGVPARNVAVLTGTRATRSGLAKKLEGWLANNVNENSTVYFYYSGHGAPDATSGQAYLVPIDGDPEYLDQTAYPLKRLYERLGALKAKRVIVMLDSCFSGAGGRSVMAKGARPLVSTVDTGIRSADGKIFVLAASGANQISGTDEEDGHGLFSYYLFSGLNGAAKDASGQVTVKSLFDFIKPKVMDDAQRANRDQVPQLQAGGAAAGDVVLREK